MPVHRSAPSATASLAIALTIVIGALAPAAHARKPPAAGTTGQAGTSAEQPKPVKPPNLPPIPKPPKLPKPPKVKPPKVTTPGPAAPSTGATVPAAPVATPATATPPATAPATNAPTANPPADSKPTPRRRSNSGANNGDTRPSDGRSTALDRVPATDAALTGGVTVERASARPDRGRENRADSVEQLEPLGPPRPSVITRFVREIPFTVRAGLLGLALLVAAMAAIALRERRRTARAQQDARADALTGIANRLAFEQRLDQELSRARRYRRPLGLILIDLDDFKAINDSEGHAAGDRVLRVVAATIAQRVRETDFVARLGGDEFVVICPETEDDGLATLADGLQQAFEPLALGASVGFAQVDKPDEDPERLLEVADEAMYRDKRQRFARRRNERTRLA